MNCQTILIIEDNEDIRDLMKMAIELEGYHVEVASNGKEGLKMLSQLSGPCLILLDLMMPIMDGWEFAKIIKQDSVLAQIPLVVVSAYGDKSKSIESKGVLNKPVDMDALFLLIKKYCGDPP